MEIKGRRLIEFLLGEYNRITTPAVNFELSKSKGTILLALTVFSTLRRSAFAFNFGLEYFKQRTAISVIRGW